MAYVTNMEGAKFWVPSMSPKGLSVYLNHRRFLLLHGPRKTTKSNTAQNMLINHCFQNDGAVFGIIVFGSKQSVGSGCWEDITGERGLLEREWFQSGTGCRWHTPPKVMSDTKMRYCRIVNAAGGYSEIQLHTIQDSEKVEEKFKDSRFSGLYLVEADRWETSSIFNGLIPQLRRECVPHEHRQIILDCNPPAIGDRHWLYRKFIKSTEGDYPPDIDPNIQEVGFVMNDNPFISDSEKEEIRTACENDPNEIARNFEGKWIASRKGSAFGYQYEKSLHVKGNVESIDPKNHSILIPPAGTFDFPTGWDMGDAMNHACVIGAKVITDAGTVRIYVIDEIVRTGVNYSAENFGQDFMRMSDYWQRVMSDRSVPRIQWKFWSDSSSLRYSAAADSSAAIALSRSTDGFINLQGVKKPSGSIKKRVNLLKRALFSQQIFVSAKCRNVVAMLENMQADEFGDVDAYDPLKHIFDALTYMLQYELPVNETNKQEEAFLVSV